MKWLQLAYSIISVNAVILALLAVIVNGLGRAGSRMTTEAKNNRHHRIRELHNEGGDPR
jgi:hypothetical protein